MHRAAQATAAALAFRWRGPSSESPAATLSRNTPDSTLFRSTRTRSRRRRGGGIRPPADAAHRRPRHRRRAALSRRRRIPEGAHVIVLLFVRTVLGWLVVIAATMICAFLIGVSGETQFSEQVLRFWSRL